MVTATLGKNLDPSMPEQNDDVYNLSPFLSPTWLPSRPILGHCRGGSLTNQILIAAFDTNLTLMSSGAL